MPNPQSRMKDAIKTHKPLVTPAIACAINISIGPNGDINRSTIEPWTFAVINAEETFANESFIYFGDTARLPYGTKSQETIIRYSKEICDFLNKKDVKLIIVACNTASALAVKFLKSYLKVPIINVIDPCVEFAS